MLNYQRVCPTAAQWLLLFLFRHDATNEFGAKGEDPGKVVPRKEEVVDVVGAFSPLKIIMIQGTKIKINLKVQRI